MAVAHWFVCSLSFLIHSDEDCGGLTILDANGALIAVEGGRCDSECKCVCDEKFCLSPRKASETADISCQFDCTCRKQCALDADYINSINQTSFNVSNIATYDDGAGSPSGNRCQAACTDCTSDPNACGDDEDCIDNGDSSSKCVEAGICTTKKEDMCDDGYAAVSGKKNKRAKCCPDTRYVYISFFFFFRQCDHFLHYYRLYHNGS